MNGANLKKYLLDTNSIIQALNSGFIFPSYQYYFSIITEIELLSFGKLTKEESNIIKLALSNFEPVDIDNKVKEATIQIRKNSNIKLPDCIIIASALSKNAVLITSDRQLLKTNLVKTIELKDLKVENKT